MKLRKIMFNILGILLFLFFAIILSYKPLQANAMTTWNFIHFLIQNSDAIGISGVQVSGYLSLDDEGNPVVEFSNDTDENGKTADTIRHNIEDYNKGKCKVEDSLGRYETKEVNGDSWEVDKTNPQCYEVTIKLNGNKFNVYLDSNGGTQGGKTQIEAQYAADMPSISGTDLPTRMGYLFDGYFDEQSQSNGTQYYNSNGESCHKWDKTEVNPSLYAHWTANEYNVTYDSQGHGTAPEGKTVTYDSQYGELPTLSATGYTFGGWYLNQACTAEKEVTADTIVKTASDHPLYAKWTANIYTVDANANGGEFPTSPSPTTTLTYTYDGASVSTSVFTIPTRTGYTFIGWFTADTGDTKVLSIDNTTLTNVGCDLADPDIHGIVYAHWTANTYTINANENGGEFPTSPSPTTTLTYTYDGASVLTSGFTEPTKTGYTFSGWFPDATGGTEVLSIDNTTLTNVGCDIADPNKHGIVYAHWTANQYIVKLDNDGGVGKVKEINAIYDEPMPTLSSDELPTKDGYKFLGYFGNAPENNSKSDSVALNLGATVQYYNADGTSARNWDKDEESSVLVANWEETANPVNPEQNQSTVTATSDSIPEYMLIVLLGLIAIAGFGIKRYSK